MLRHSQHAKRSSKTDAQLIGAGRVGAGSAHAGRIGLRTRSRAVCGNPVRALNDQSIRREHYLEKSASAAALRLETHRVISVERGLLLSRAGLWAHRGRRAPT
jgi:hypothetical protein